MSIVQNGVQNGVTPAVDVASPTRARPNTFRPIRLDPQRFAAFAFSEFVQRLLLELDSLRRERSAFYEELRRSNSRWAINARRALTLLGAVAVLLTALVGAVRFAPDLLPWSTQPDADKRLLLWVAIIYGVMGAISFYERGSDKTTAYFRQIATILAIRDLWTKLQFAILKELRAQAITTDRSTEEATRGRIVVIAEAFCNDLDKIATGELSEFRTDFMDSLKELQEASQKGLQEITKQLEERAKADDKAAADAKAAADKKAADEKAAADKQAAEAKATAKAAEEAKRPGFVNVSIVGDFEGEVVVSVGGAEVARSTGKTIGLERIPPGFTKIAAQAKKGTKILDASIVVDIKPGLQEVRLTLS